MDIECISAREQLLSSGLNVSYQRVRILEHLMKRSDHPNVSMVYDALMKEIPTLSRATVYNTLNALVNKGLVTPLTIKPEESRYDYKRNPHHHFLCRRCGSIFDVEVRCTYAASTEIDGHRVEDIHGYFKGTCKNCLRQERIAGAGGKKSSRHEIENRKEWNG